MNKNEELLIRLYTGLKNLDPETMMSCYHEEATFKDPVFELHSKQEIDGMWTMLCQRAKEFELSFDSVQADESSGSAYIEAAYLFSQTNRKVLNKIDARFRFKEGLIIEQRDHFNFWRWSQHALGLPGYLLGWTSFLQKKVQQQAGDNLQKFMNRS